MSVQFPYIKLLAYTKIDNSGNIKQKINHTSVTNTPVNHSLFEPLVVKANTQYEVRFTDKIIVADRK